MTVLLVDIRNMAQRMGLVGLHALSVMGSGDDDIVPSNPDLLTQIDDILQPCLSCHPVIVCTAVLQGL